VTIVQFDHEELPVPTNRLDLAATQLHLDLIGRSVVPGGSRMVQSHFAEIVADHRLGQMPARDLDFGELRQMRSPSGTAGYGNPAMDIVSTK